MGTEQPPGRELSIAVAAVARVGRAMVGAGGLADLGVEALAEIGYALGLDAAAMYLPDVSNPNVLCRYVVWTRGAHAISAVERLSLGAHEWQLLASTPGPMLFRGQAASLIPNPFEPAPSAWVALPLISQRSLIGVVVGSAPAPLSLDEVTAATLHSIGALVSAGAATALLRAEFQRVEVERERMRLAAELHEGLAQDLSLAVRELAFLATDPPEEAAQASRQRLEAAVTEAHRVVRAGLEDLSGRGPVAGLHEAIREAAERFERRGVTVTLRLESITRPIRPAAVAAMLRVLHEALANVQRHSGVGAAEVSVTERRGELRLTVADAGRGFNPDNRPLPGDGHFGLAIMHERALALGGDLWIRSSHAGGTRVTLTIPIDQLASA